MTSEFLTLLPVSFGLCLLQFLAALPWLAAVDPRLLLGNVRRPAAWGWTLLGLAVAAVGVALFLEANYEPVGLSRLGRVYGAFLQVQLTADVFVLVLFATITLWPKGGAVAFAAFRECLRQPMFWLLFALALGLIWLVPLLPYFTLGEDLKMVKELGFDVIMLFTVVFVIIAASMSISEEIEGRTAVTLMSKPVSRRQFLLGKFFGIFLAGLVMVAMLGWTLVWMFLFKQNLDPPIRTNPLEQIDPDPAWLVSFMQAWIPEGPAASVVQGAGRWFDDSLGVLPGLIIVSCQVMVLLAIATALATRLSPVVNIPICLVFYLLGHLTPILIAVSQNRYPLVAFMARVFDTVLPGLEHFNIGAAIIRETPPPPADFALYTANVSLYAVMYTAVALLFGLILFEDRDVA